MSLSAETLAAIEAAASGGAAPEVIGGNFKAPPRPTDSTENMAIASSPTLLRDPYVEGNAYELFASLPLEQRVLFQQSLVGLGKLKAKDVDWGEPGDTHTLKAFDEILALANASGTTADATLQRLMSRQIEFGGGGGGGGGGPRLPAYVAPDPATLAQTVKSSLRERLRRDPSEAELDALARELSGFARQAYDSQIAAAQGASTTDVDPGARFAELIETKYANELDLIETRDEGAVSQQQAQGQLSFVNRVMGGI